MLYLIHPEELKEMYKAQGYSILSITGCNIYIRKDPKRIADTRGFFRDELKF